MTLSPFEIERREFGTAAFGYKKHEVDQFITDIHGSYGQLWEERGALREELERLHERVERYTAQEEQLVSTLRLAQDSADRATEQARKEAELVLREATQQARDIVHKAHEERQQLDTIVRELRAAEREARHRLRTFASAVLTGLDDDESTTEAQARSLRAVVSGTTPASAQQGQRRSEPTRRDRPRPTENDAAPFGHPPRFERAARAERRATTPAETAGVNGADQTPATTT